MLNRNRTSDTDEEREGPQFFNSWFWIASAFLGLVVIMGAGVLIARSVSGPSAAPSASSTPTQVQTSPSSSSSTKQAAGGDCAAVTPADVGPQTLPTTAPPTTWEQFGGGTHLSPTTTAGPYVRDSTIRRCFAQTRLGAMTAATNIAMATVAEPAIARAALERQMTPGAMRTDALAQVGGVNEAGERSSRVRGARVLSYSETRAITEVVLQLRRGEDALLAIQSAMVWDEGDWKVDGANTASASAVESLDGYVVWEAGR